MLKLPLTSLTAVVLALIYVVLCVRVVRGRMSSRTSLGDGNTTTGAPAAGAAPAHAPLLVAVRAHGNFAEYVPFSLLLLALIEGQGGARPVVIGLATLLVIARLAHPFGLTGPAPNPPRAIGFAGNLIMLLAAALYLGWLMLA